MIIGGSQSPHLTAAPAKARVSGPAARQPDNTASPIGSKQEAAANRKGQGGMTDTQSDTIRETTGSRNSAAPGIPELSEEQRKILNELKQTDRAVRAHEAAHKAVAGALAKGAASFSYQKGPDGQRYAVGGEVSIDVSAVSGDPQATLAKAIVIQAAALAPADPSNADRAVAARAAQMAAAARAEIAAENLEKARGIQDTLLHQQPSADAYQAYEPATKGSHFSLRV